MCVSVSMWVQGYSGIQGYFFSEEMQESFGLRSLLYLSHFWNLSKACPVESVVPPVMLGLWV